MTMMMMVVHGLRVGRRKNLRSDTTILKNQKRNGARLFVSSIASANLEIVMV
jgi:hypothetical protein